MSPFIRYINLRNLSYIIDFQITSEEYENKAGVPLPKNKGYLRNKSALAQLAKERGYIITDIVEETAPQRTVLFKRKGI